MKAIPFPTLGLSLPEHTFWEWLTQLMAVISSLWTSEVGKVLMLVFKLGGCLVQQLERLLVLVFEALAFLVCYRPTVLSHCQGALWPSLL